MSEVAERVHGPGCGCTRCVGFEAGNVAALKHGATSEARIRPLARNQKRRVLRQMGTRVSDLTPLGRALLEHYCRTTSKLVLIDDWIDRNGLLRDDGTPQPCMGLYVSLTNTATRTLAKLERHLGVREDDPFAALQEHLAELRAGKAADGD